MSNELINGPIEAPYQHRVKVMHFAIHFIVLAIIFIMPEVLMSWGRTIPKFVYVHTFGYILVFYVNYFLFIDRFLFKRDRLWLFFVANVLLIILYLLLIFGVHCLCSPPDAQKVFEGSDVPPIFPHEVNDKWLLREVTHLFSRDFVMMFLSICVSVALKLSEKWIRWEQYEQKMTAERKEMELKNLKNQLNPHFLFNTLNNIYVLISISQERAQYAVHELSQLLRYMLYENDSKSVSLDKEMLFVKNYIELMRLRLGSNVDLRVDINEKEGIGLNIAPLLFISLVENAFKHGVSASKQSVIDIKIKVMGTKVVCRVDNSYFPKNDDDKSGSGIGLVNLKRQLAILYNGRYSLTQKVTDSIFSTDLEINLQDNA